MHETIPLASLRQVQLTIVYTAILWLGTFTTSVRLRLCEPGNKTFVTARRLFPVGHALPQFGRNGGYGRIVWE